MQVCMYGRMLCFYVCMNVCVYVYLYVCMYACVYFMYILIYTLIMCMYVCICNCINVLILCDVYAKCNTHIKSGICRYVGPYYVMWCMCINVGMSSHNAKIMVRNKSYRDGGFQVWLLVCSNPTRNIPPWKCMLCL